jgi:MFS family permease
LLLAPRDEPAPRPAVVDEPRWHGAFAGLRLIRSSPLLAPTAGALAMAGFFNGAIEAVFVIFVVRNLGLEPFVVGAIFACGSVGFIIGALLPERLAARIGLGWSLVATLALVGVSDLAVALAAGPTPFVVGLLAVAQMLFGIGLTAFGANEVTLRQSVTAESTLGRVNAAFYVLSSGSAPFGALAGGALGSALGVRYALLLAAAGEVLAVLPLLTGRFRMAAGSFASSPLSDMAQD